MRFPFGALGGNYVPESSPGVGRSFRIGPQPETASQNFASEWEGVRTESWTAGRSGLEVRMYSREKVELFLLATEDGMGPTAAAKFAGVSVGAATK